MTASSKHLYSIVFLIAVACMLCLQLPWISRPPFDYHAFRQAQTLSTVELFARDGIEMTRAKANYVGEPGIFVLEFPLFQAVCALLYGWFGPHVWLVRLLNLFFTLANAGLVFAIGRRLFGREAGFSAMIMYLLAPLNLIYMASTLIDVSATCFSLATFLFALRILHPASDEEAASRGIWAGFALACLVTCLIKTLYLFPTCVLVGATLLVERRITARVFAVGAWMSISLGLFYLWLRHGQRLNDSSYFTRGISATTVIGFELLATFHYYKEVVRITLLNLAGPVGGLLSAVALWVVFLRRTSRTDSHRFSLAVMTASIVGYYLLFPRANRHDYYSLVISPYACLIAGFGAVEVVRRIHVIRSYRLTSFANVPILMLLALMLSALVFLRPALLGKKPRLAPDPYHQKLHALSQGRFEPYAFGMVFISPDPRFPPPGNVGTDVPSALYATGLRGTARLLTNGLSAIPIWKEYRPHYRNLRYVVFYGLEPPNEIVQACRKTVGSDAGHRWFAYRVE